MKKVLIVLVALVTFQLSAQNSFYKGALVFDVNTGLTIYSVKQHYEIKGTNISKDTVSGAGCHGPNFGVQYGILNWLALGLRYQYDTYYTSADKYTHITPSVYGQEFGFVIDAHPVRVKHFDLITGINVGYSNMVYHTHDPFKTEIYGSGSWFDLHVIPRLYLGPVGLSVNFSVPFIKYANLTTSSDQVNSVLFSSWKASGFGIGCGISLRILKPRD